MPAERVVEDDEEGEDSDAAPGSPRALGRLGARRLYSPHDLAPAAGDALEARMPLDLVEAVLMNTRDPAEELLRDNLLGSTWQEVLQNERSVPWQEAMLSRRLMQERFYGEALFSFEPLLGVEPHGSGLHLRILSHRWGHRVVDSSVSLLPEYGDQAFRCFRGVSRFLFLDLLVEQAVFSVFLVRDELAVKVWLPEADFLLSFSPELMVPSISAAWALRPRARRLAPRARQRAGEEELSG